MLSEVDELFSQFLPNDIPPVAEVLERFDPNHSGPFDRNDKKIQPHLPSAIKHSERQQRNTGSEDKCQLKESDDMGQNGIGLHQERFVGFDMSPSHFVYLLSLQLIGLLQDLLHLAVFLHVPEVVHGKWEGNDGGAE